MTGWQLSLGTPWYRAVFRDVDGRTIMLVDYDARNQGYEWSVKLADMVSFPMRGWAPTEDAAKAIANTAYTYMQQNPATFERYLL